MFPWPGAGVTCSPNNHEDNSTIFADLTNDLRWRLNSNEEQNEMDEKEHPARSTVTESPSSSVLFIPLPALEERLLHKIMEEHDARMPYSSRKRGKAEQDWRHIRELSSHLVQSSEEVSLYYPSMPSRELLEAMVGGDGNASDVNVNVTLYNSASAGPSKRVREDGSYKNGDKIKSSSYPFPSASSSSPQGSSDDLSRSPWSFPFMSFAEGFQPVDHVGRLFVTPQPAAMQRAAIRCREPCRPPRAPKRVYLSTSQDERIKSGEIRSRTSSDPLTRATSSSGIQMLRWAPPSFGHLFFSADLQGVTRLWRSHTGDMLNYSNGGSAINGKENSSGSSSLLATYHAHHKPVKSLFVTQDATCITSGSTDGTIAMWDVETGSCLHHLCTASSTDRRTSQQRGSGNSMHSSSSSAFPPVVDHLHHPSDEQHLILAAVDRKVVLYDVRVPSQRVYCDKDSSGADAVYCSYFKPQREYQGHMGTILHLSTLGSSGSKLLTTSEDKTLRTWDYSIPIQIKQFADAGMPAISHVIPHPRQKEWLVAQSLNNKIIVFEDEGGGRIRPCPHTEYTGHIIAGTRCQLGFSHDGVYLSSGDFTGQLFIWKWDKRDSGKLVKKFKAHQGMLTTHLWHPSDPSRVVTGGWDGSIKEWI